jgi:glucose/arabinose dehydrogenase
MVLRWFLSVALVFAAVSPVWAQISLTSVSSGQFTSPLALSGAPNDPDPNRAFVLQRNGLVRSMNLTTGAATGTFLDLPAALTATGGGTILQAGEQGLLGMAFSPGYTSAGNGFLYVNYIGSNGTNGGETRVDRFTVTNGVLSPTSRANIITIDQPDNQTNHKGGWIGFSPVNGFLHIATGDGGGSNDPLLNGQNNTQLLGKLLRISPNTSGTGYTIPQGQLFGAGTRAEIFSTGLRNPFRGSFDRVTGDLFMGDVGQGAREEVDFISASSTGGQNFGWRLREGRIPTPGVGGAQPPGNVEPIYDYTRTNGDGTVIGGYVYRGGNILDGGQSLDGTYIFGDFVSGRIFSFRYTGSDIATDTAIDRNLQGVLGGFNLSAFGEDNAGRLYALGLNGNIYRFTGAAIPEPSSLLLGGVAILSGWFVYRRRSRKQEGLAAAQLNE